MFSLAILGPQNNTAAMKKVFLVLLVLLLAVAYFTKPDDKTCIIEGVKAVWGKMVPDVYKRPDLFGYFMDNSSKSVVVKDWLFWKVVNYKVDKEQKLVAIGAFRNVFALVKPYETKEYIPPVPKR
jgi:hypothetical protein